jgi:hypothetical protein
MVNGKKLTNCRKIINDLLKIVIRVQVHNQEKKPTY